MNQRQVAPKWFRTPRSYCGLLLFLLAACPALQGAEQVYLIQATDLLNMPNECGDASRYAHCSGSTQPGFQFSDILPAGSVVTSVTIEINHGVQCAADSYAFETEFNDVAAGTFSSPRWCDCTFRRQRVTFNPPASSYNVHGINTLLITNPSSCQGLVPDSDLGSAYARVTVVFTASDTGGGRGGGDCDLTPVLDRIDAMESAMEASDQAMAELVTAENETTRKAVGTEHDQTRAELSEDHEALRALLRETLLRHLVEQELAGAQENGQMSASTCLPEENGGSLETTISIVFDTVQGYREAGCDVSSAELNFQRGTEELDAGRFLKACDWFVKAYSAASKACP